MTVGEDESHNLVEASFEIGKVRQDEVNAGLDFFGKEHPAVDDEDLAFGLQHGHIPSDLTQSPQRGQTQDIGFGQLRHRQFKFFLHGSSVHGQRRWHER